MELIKAVKFINSTDMAKKIRVNKKKFFKATRNCQQLMGLEA